MKLDYKMNVKSLLWIFLFLARGQQVRSVSKMGNSGLCKAVSAKPPFEIVSADTMSLPDFKQQILAQLSGYIRGSSGYIPLRAVNNSMWSHDGSEKAVFMIRYDCAYLEFSMQRPDIHSPMNITVRLRVFPGFNRTIGPHVLFEGEKPGHGYRCDSEQTIDLEDGSEFVLDYVHIEAFRNAYEADFYQVEEYCPTGSYKLIVIVLLALIVILCLLDSCYSNCICYKICTRCTKMCCCLVSYCRGKRKSKGKSKGTP